MRDVQEKIGGLVDRLANRAIWRLAGARRDIKTDIPLVSFTFDDVPDSALYEGARILERYDARGTFYIAAWPLARSELRRRYRSCRAGGEAINRESVDPLMLKAVEIRQPEQHAETLTRWIDALVSEPGWLIFFTHDIAPRPTPHGCTPETFDRLVRYSVEKGCRVLPVDEVLDRFNW